MKYLLRIRMSKFMRISANADPDLQSGCYFSFQCNKLKKKFIFKQEIEERDSYSSFNRASFVIFVTAKVTI